MISENKITTHGTQRKEEISKRPIQIKKQQKLKKRLIRKHSKMKCGLTLCIPFHRKKQAISLSHLATISCSQNTTPTTSIDLPTNTPTATTKTTTTTTTTTEEHCNDSSSPFDNKEIQREIVVLLESSMSSLAPHGSDEDLYIYVSASMNNINSQNSHQ